MHWFFETEKTIGRGGSIRGDYFAVSPDVVDNTDGGVFFLLQTRQGESISFWLNRADSLDLARGLAEQYREDLWAH